MRRLAVAVAAASLVVSWLGPFGTGDRALRSRPTAQAAEPAKYPAGFSDSLVAAVPAPTAAAFTPDGRLLVSSQPGHLLLHRDGKLLEEPVLDISGIVCPRLEQGLLGIAVDPQFAVNGHIYLYYTIDRFDCVNRVSRFTMTGDRADPASELVLLDNIPSPNGNHIAGDMHFGKDGYLYVSIGDGGCDYEGGGCAGDNDASRDRHVLQGKILRVTSTGQPAPGNPFAGPDSARCHRTGRTKAGQWCAETFAWGLRNPFRIAFDPDADETRFFINDVGQDHWEEIDVGQIGADYGWSVREGHCANGSRTNCGRPPEGMTNPIFDYHHDTGCTAVTGGAFVPRGTWPDPYDGAYLFADYTCGTIFRLVHKADGSYTSEPFVTGLGAGSAVHMLFGPGSSGRALYYTTYANGGEVHRIEYTGTANRMPVAAVKASRTSGAAPLRVDFDAGASSDPDGDELRYLWDFGDGSAPVESGGPTVSHTYEAGTAAATLRVRDARGATSAPATVRIVSGDSPPAARIDAPSAGHRFRVGEAMTLRASATDEEDGPLAGKQLSWTVVLHHATHTHPFLGPVTGAEVSFVAPRPENFLAASNSYLEVVLTATDSAGLQTTISRRLEPLAVKVTFATEPAGLLLEVDGMTFAAPETFVSWAGLP
ncbi:MAG: PQQ-dependent sugar dehydrogenase, partial [Actinomycetota bacterium]